MNEREKHLARIPFLMRMQEINDDILSKLDAEESDEYQALLVNPDIQTEADLPEKYQNLLKSAKRVTSDIKGMV